MIPRISVLLFALQVTFQSARAQNSDPVSLLSFGAAPAGISRACKSEYGETVPSCTTSDFSAAGASCSDACETALLQVQSNVQTACSGAVVDSTSLLSRILHSEIIGALCPNPSASTSTAKAATTRAPAPKSSTSSTIVSSSPKSAISKASGISSSITSVTRVTSVTSTTHLPQKDTTTSVTTSSLGSSLILASSSTDVTRSSTSPTAAPQSTPMKKLTMQQQQIAAESNTGGGSPFDIMSPDGSSRPIVDISLMLLVMACTGLLLG